MLVYVGLVVILASPCWTQDMSSWWSKVQTSSLSLCVVDNTCHQHTQKRLDADYNSYSSLTKTPCCKGCSCHSSCGVEGNCCYPNDHIYTDRRRQNCTFPIENFDYNNQFKSYYMYVECDPNIRGSRALNEQESTASSMAPVFSKASGRIYYNRAIAECNGVHDGIDWRLTVTCPDIYYTNFDIDDLKNRVRGCTLSYEYPGTPSDIRREECFHDLIQTCKSEFRIPAGLNMSKDEIKNACEKGPLSPFRSDVFKRLTFANIFCYVCDHYFLDLPDDGMCTVLDTAGGGKTVSQHKFSVIISKPKRITEEKALHHSHQKLACKWINDTELSDDCRPVHCPSGQFHQSGRCQFIMDTLFMSRIFLIVNLQAIFRPPNLQAYANIESFTYLNFPWSGSNWKLMHMYCELNDSSTEDATNRCATDNIVAVLEIEQLTVDPSSFYADTLRRLQMVWSWEIGGRIIQFKQMISPHPKFKWPYDHGRKSVYTSHAVEINQGLTDLSKVTSYIRKNFASEYWNPKAGPVMTKLIYCEQIVLEEDEYVIYEAENLLFHKSTNTLFRYGEHAINYDVVKICLSDSDLYVMSSSDALNAIDHFRFTFLGIFAAIHVVVLS